MPKRVGIVACSNAMPSEWEAELCRLKAVLREMGYDPVCSPHLFARESVFSGTPAERADALMEFYRDDSIEEIFDVSGGDLANEVISELDFELIACSQKRLWGYSDLTCVLNAIYARAGRPSVLYQIRNLIGLDGEGQRDRFENGALAKFDYRFLRGSAMEGVVVGGNVRCLLKLAGTPYWPDVRGKILLLEGLGTSVANAAAYIAQLDQLGALRDAAGVLLGTFTKMEARGDKPTFAELILRKLPADKPLAKTDLIGHGADSRAIVIGESVRLAESRA